MKRNLFIVMTLFAFVSLKAQIKVNESFVFSPGDDSTKYVLFPVMVTDTAEVQKVVNDYRDLRIDKLSQQILAKEEENRKIDAVLRVRYGRKLLAEDGSYEMYELLLTELETNSNRAQSFRQSSESQKKEIWGPNKKLKTWVERYEKEAKDAKIRMRKKQETMGVILEYAEWVKSQNRISINVLKTDIGEIKQGNLFNDYLSITDSQTLPTKQVYVQKENPYYVPSLSEEFAGMPYWRAYEIIGNRDLKKQEEGWEWIKGYSYELVERKYPYEFSAEKYSSHPEYLVIGYNIFDQEGNLVRIKSVMDLSEITRELTQLQYQRDYLSNKYNILSEDKEVQYVVSNRLGLRSEYYESLIQICDDAFTHDMGTKYGTLKQRVNSFIKLKQDYFNLAETELRMFNDRAMRFCKQLELDHENEYKYVLSSQRLTDVSFIITFGTTDFKPTSSVIVEYYSSAPFESAKWRIIKYEEF